MNLEKTPARRVSTASSVRNSRPAAFERLQSTEKRRSGAIWREKAPKSQRGSENVPSKVHRSQRRCVCVSSKVHKSACGCVFKPIFVSRRSRTHSEMRGSCGIAPPVRFGWADPSGSQRAPDSDVAALRARSRGPFWKDSGAPSVGDDPFHSSKPPKALELAFTNEIAIPTRRAALGASGTILFVRQNPRWCSSSRSTNEIAIATQDGALPRSAVRRSLRGRSR